MRSGGIGRPRSMRCSAGMVRWPRSRSRAPLLQTILAPWCCVRRPNGVCGRCGPVVANSPLARMGSACGGSPGGSRRGGSERVGSLRPGNGDRPSRHLRRRRGAAPVARPGAIPRDTFGAWIAPGPAFSFSAPARYQGQAGRGERGPAPGEIRRWLPLEHPYRRARRAFPPDCVAHPLRTRRTRYMGHRAMNAHRVASRTPERSPGRGTRRLAPFPGRTRRARFRDPPLAAGSGLREPIPTPTTVPRKAVRARRPSFRSAANDSILGALPACRGRTTPVGQSSGRPGPKNHGTTVVCGVSEAVQGGIRACRLAPDNCCYRAPIT